MKRASCPNTPTIATLVLPPLCVGKFQFDVHRASACLRVELNNFFKDYATDGVKVCILEDPETDGRFTQAFKDVWTESDRNVVLLSGNIVHMKTEHGVASSTVVNEANNSMLKPGGFGVNYLLHEFDSTLASATRSQGVEGIKVGAARAVKLPASSPLASQEGVDFVIHALGPNMNPKKLNCLNGDYDRGCTELRATFKSIFEVFATIHQIERVVPVKAKTKITEHFAPAPGSSKSQIISPELHPNPLVSQQVTRRPPTSNWQSALVEYVTRPESFKAKFVQRGADVSVIFDAYPKAKHHYLTLPMKLVYSIYDLREEHISLLERMHEVACEFVSKLKTAKSFTETFRIGYHAIPSMKLVHLHIISNDFNSECLKNKKHWNSFTTPFFLPSSDVIDQVKKYGKVNIDKAEYEKFMKMDLACHRCRSPMSNMPTLKSHILKCKEKVEEIK